eukprot:GAHX01002321.1.p1 GENE.GAHX01002321.1~~GAHX01002321.1.p1  ORF type:complete len:336 (+),score=56.96 GAHX01002321.1:255-1262(+)
MQNNYIHFKTFHKNTKFISVVLILVFLLFTTLLKITTDEESSNIRGDTDTRQTIDYLPKEKTRLEAGQDLKKESERLENSYKVWSKLPIFVYYGKNPTTIHDGKILHTVDNIQPDKYLEFLNEVKLSRSNLMKELDIYRNIISDYKDGKATKLSLSRTVAKDLLFFSDNLEYLLSAINIEGDKECLIKFHENFIEDKFEVLVKISKKIKNKERFKNRNNGHSLEIDESPESFLLSISESDRWSLVEMIKRKHIIVDFFLFVQHIYIKQNKENIFHDLKIKNSVCKELDRKINETLEYIKSLNGNTGSVNTVLRKLDLHFDEFGNRAFDLFETDHN